MAPKMLIATRFGLGIKDPSWFEHRLVLLAAITAPSLLAQDDQHFEWVLRVDPDLPEVVRDRLAEVLSPFEGRAHIYAKGRRPDALKDIVETRGLVNRDGCLLVGRIDDDDAWGRSTVADVRRRVEAWCAKGNGASGYGLSFANGLVWVMYDMLDLDQLQKRSVNVVRPATVRTYRYPFTSISGYTYAKLPDAIALVAIGHSRVQDAMREKGFTIDIVDTHDPMWLYCRHKQTDSPIARGEGPELEITVADMEKRFGIDQKLTHRYIAEREQHGYGRTLRKFEKRGRLVRDLRDLGERLCAADGDRAEVDRLERRRAELSAALAELMENVVSGPGDELPHGAEKEGT